MGFRLLSAHDLALSSDAADIEHSVRDRDSVGEAGVVAGQISMSFWKRRREAQSAVAQARSTGARGGRICRKEEPSRSFRNPAHLFACRSLYRRAPSINGCHSGSGLELGLTMAMRNPRSPRPGCVVVRIVPMGAGAGQGGGHLPAARWSSLRPLYDRADRLASSPSHSLHLTANACPISSALVYITLYSVPTTPSVTVAAPVYRILRGFPPTRLAGSNFQPLGCAVD